MSPCPAEKQGLEISEVSRETFLDFVRRHATSEEIGRIGTCLDGERADAPAGELLLLGLMGCSRVCAVAIRRFWARRSARSRSMTPTARRSRWPGIAPI